MKNNFLLTVLIVLIGYTGIAANSGDTATSEACFLLSEDTDVREIISTIIAYTGLCPNFEVREADVKNAKAAIRDKKRVILYNKEYIAKLNRKSRTYWAGVSVLAHELGHHLNGHTVSYDKSDLEAELEADQFAGYILRKMGASLEEAQAAIRTVGREHETESHPGKGSRLNAIRKGWTSADLQLVKSMSSGL